MLGICMKHIFLNLKECNSLSYEIEIYIYIKHKLIFLQNATLMNIYEYMSIYEQIDLLIFRCSLYFPNTRKILKI